MLNATRGHSSPSRANKNKFRVSNENGVVADSLGLVIYGRSRESQEAPRQLVLQNDVPAKLSAEALRPRMDPGRERPIATTQPCDRSVGAFRNVQCMNDAGDVTENGEEDVDEQV